MVQRLCDRLIHLAQEILQLKPTVAENRQLTSEASVIPLPTGGEEWQPIEVPNLSSPVCVYIQSTIKPYRCLSASHSDLNKLLNFAKQ